MIKNSYCHDNKKRLFSGSTNCFFRNFIFSTSKIKPFVFMKKMINIMQKKIIDFCLRSLGGHAKVVFVDA